MLPPSLIVLFSSAFLVIAIGQHLRRWRGLETLWDWPLDQLPGQSAQMKKFWHQDHDDDCSSGRDDGDDDHCDGDLDGYDDDDRESLRVMSVD